MKHVCKLYLVRHGESVANRDKLVGGHFDSVLTDTGRQQAGATKEMLSKVHFDAVYSSDLSRAVETAAIIFGRPVPEARRLSGLRERNFGKLEGGPAKDWFVLDKKYEEQYAHLPFEDRWAQDYADFIENDKAMYERLESALLTIAKKHRGQTVLVALHGGPIRILLMKLGHAAFLPAGSFANAGYVELDYDGTAFSIARAVGVNLVPPASE